MHDCTDSFPLKCDSPPPPHTQTYTPFEDPSFVKPVSLSLSLSRSLANTHTHTHKLGFTSSLLFSPIPPLSICHFGCCSYSKPTYVSEPEKARQFE